MSDSTNITSEIVERWLCSSGLAAARSIQDRIEVIRDRGQSSFSADIDFQFRTKPIAPNLTGVTRSHAVKLAYKLTHRHESLPQILEEKRSTQLQKQLDELHALVRDGSMANKRQAETIHDLRLKLDQTERALNRLRRGDVTVSDSIDEQRFVEEGGNG